MPLVAGGALAPPNYARRRSFSSAETTADASLRPPSTLDIGVNCRMQDIRLALRNVRLRPAFSVVAILTLALGIGANTAVFTVLNAVVLAPLPYADPTTSSSSTSRRPSCRRVGHALQLRRLAGAGEVLLRHGGVPADRT